MHFPICMCAFMCSTLLLLFLPLLHQSALLFSSRSPPFPLFPLLCDAFNRLAEYFISRGWVQMCGLTTGGHRCQLSLSFALPHDWLMHLHAFCITFLKSSAKSVFHVAVIHHYSIVTKSIV